MMGWFMKLLKSFISFTFPLIIMLFIYSVYLLVNKIVEDYQRGIINDYSIVIITSTPFVSVDEVAGRFLAFYEERCKRGVPAERAGTGILDVMTSPPDRRRSMIKRILYQSPLAALGKSGLLNVTGGHIIVASQVPPVLKSASYTAMLRTRLGTAIAAYFRGLGG